MRGGPVADRRLDPAALHPTATFVDGWLQARPRDWLAQVGTVALDPRRGYASALVAPLGHVTVLGDHVHAIRLANAVTDQARRQVKQVTLGHRGRTYDPPYRIRKLLVTAAEQLTQRGRARLQARDTMKIERGADRSALDSTRWPLSWGVASRYRTTCRCGPAAHRPRPSFGTLQVLRGIPPT
jgi:transposase